MSVFLAKLPFILVAVLIFGVLIAVHELGHFLAAKLSGVQVNEFSIGMGPCLWKREKGETRYSLRLLPIGGFCAMEGESEESDSPRALGNQGFWKRLLIFAAGADGIPHRGRQLRRDALDLIHIEAGGIREEHRDDEKAREKIHPRPGGEDQEPFPEALVS